MMKKYFLSAAFILLPSLALSMQVMKDSELSGVTGQALLVSDYVGPTGAGNGSTASDFGFFRMGLDAEVSVNMNIDRLQFGCGGYNEIVTSGCDIDMEFVSFLGLNPTGKGPAGNKSSSAADRKLAVESDFKMLRPYLELAVINPGSASSREVVGFKVGAESATGYFGVGCSPVTPGCGSSHRGISSFSGYMNVFMNGKAEFNTGLGGGTACIGNPIDNSNCNGAEFYNYGNGVPVDVSGGNLGNVSGNQTSTAFTGTRFNKIAVRGLRLNSVYGAGGLIGILNPSEMYAIMEARLSDVHGFILNDTRNFGVSFQRQHVAFPNYNKVGSTYTANPGWWMNVPRVELAGMDPETVEMGCPGFLCLGLLDSFNAPGIDIGIPDLKDTPPVNCYGNLRFC